MRPEFLRNVRTGAALAAVGVWCSLALAAPAGELLAYTVEYGGANRRTRVMVANRDGSEARLLAEGPWRGRAPAISPDGKRLVFQATDEIGLHRLRVVELTGGKPREVALGAYPQWSRDGKRLLFSRRTRTAHQLYVAKADGSDLKRRLQPLAPGQIGRWSPDETLLATVAPVIIAGRDRWQLQIRPATGGAPIARVDLPIDAGQVAELDWSPDGKRLLLTVARNIRYDLFVVEVDGPKPRRLKTPLRAGAALGRWSRDGKEIIFRASGGASGVRLMAMDADGGNPRLLWERPGVLTGFDLYQPAPVKVAAKPDPKPAPPKPVAKPKPAPKPVEKPKPATPEPKPLGPMRQILTKRFVVVSRQDSPNSLELPLPATPDFAVTVEVLESIQWKPRRQGIGFTLHLADGALYRGNLLHTDEPWATLQGRQGDGPVRLLDGKRLPAGAPHFDRGFHMSAVRRGKTLTLSINGVLMLTQEIGEATLTSLTLTVENFDDGFAKVRVGRVLLQETVDAPK